MREAQCDVHLAKDIYRRPSLDQAIKEFTKQLRVSILQEDHREAVVSITDPTGAAPDDQTVREFLNRLLDLSVLAQIEDDETDRPADAEALSKP